MSDVGTIEDKHQALVGRLDEAVLRLWAAVEARTLGRGGVSTVAKATGLSRTTIYSGLKDLGSPPPSLAPPAAVGAASTRRIRAAGGGRKKLTDKAFCATLMPWLSPEAIRSRRCAGRARARLGLRRNWPSRATKSASGVSVTFSRTLATVSKRPARPGKSATIRTGTPNSPISLARRRSTKRLVIL